LTSLQSSRQGTTAVSEEEGDDGAVSATLLTIEVPATQSQVAVGLPSFTDPDTLDFHLSPGSLREYFWAEGNVI
jgi:hypothetical protein